jgi:hypothetical protein
MKKPLSERLFYLERVMGIEPTLFAWEARVLPLNDTRTSLDCRRARSDQWHPLEMLFGDERRTVLCLCERLLHHLTDLVKVALS